MAKKQSSSNLVAENRKARHKFVVLDHLECGIALTGTEVKSLRAKQISLDEAYARITEGQLWLIQCHINQYEKGTCSNHDPVRPRKLLARRQEIRKWEPKVKQKGLTLVPLKAYFNERGLAKVLIGLVEGKTVADKRQKIKKRDDQRQIRQAQARRR